MECAFIEYHSSFISTKYFEVIYSIFHSFVKVYSGVNFSILNKSENATLQLSIFYEKVLDKKYLLKA